MSSVVTSETNLAQVALGAAGAVFSAIGRHVAFLDAEFRIVYAASGLREMIDERGLARLETRPVADFFGPELFGPTAPLRMALLRGERREALNVSLRTSRGGRRVSFVAAPTPRGEFASWDPRVKYVVVVEDGVIGPEEELRRALDANRWRRAETARSLGISRATLWRRMRAFGLL